MIVVTGGAGFIGSAMIWRLNEAGYTNILVIDDLGEDEKWKNLTKRKFVDIIAIKSGLSFVEKNISSIKAIFHMGACSATTEKNVDYLLENNFRYSAELYKLCAEYKSSFFYASSGATYGAEEKDFSDLDAGKKLLAPINPYGFSKELFDRWVSNQKKAPKHWAGFKFFNVYGPNEYHKKKQSSVVNQAYAQIQKTGTLKLFKSHRQDFSDGEQRRDFIYIKDVVEVMYEVFQRKSSLINGVYNLGTGKARSFNELAKAIFSALGSAPRIEYIDTPEEIRNQYQYFTEAKMDRLFDQGFDLLRFKNLEDGVKDYVQCFLSKEDPYL